MNRRILLINVDSKIPNLALMKISNYYKLQNDKVGFNISNPDIIYISIIFKRNKNKGILANHLYPNAKIIYGGPGYDPSIKLPEEIEQTPPDLNLFQSKYSVARVTSGCFRRCHFCVVPLLDPFTRKIMSPILQYKENTILRLLDDNILFDKEAFTEVINFVKEKNIIIRFEYLDIRLITNEIALQLKSVKHYNNTLFFSFDFTNMEKSVRKGINILFEAGFKSHQIKFLMYCHDESQLEDVKYRWSIIRDEFNCEGFVMFNIDNLTKKTKKIRRITQRPALYRNLTKEEIFS